MVMAMGYAYGSIKSEKFKEFLEKLDVDMKIRKPKDVISELKKSGLPVEEN